MIRPIVGNCLISNRKNDNTNFGNIIVKTNDIDLLYDLYRLNDIPEHPVWYEIISKANSNLQGILIDGFEKDNLRASSDKSVKMLKEGDLDLINYLSSRQKYVALLRQSIHSFVTVSSVKEVNNLPELKNKNIVLK